MISLEVRSFENCIIADEPSVPRVLMSGSGRNIKRKLHNDELETGKEKTENMVKKSRNKYDRGKEQDCKLFVNLSELSDDVDFNPKVFLRRVDEFEIKKRRTSAVQMTRSGRKIRKKTWWDEVDEIPTSEGENELSGGTQDDEATSEFTESADDDVDGYTDYFDHVDLGKENSERPANKQVKNYVSADVPCALCNKTVSSKPYLQMHMKYVHKDDENVLKYSQRPDLFGTETEVNEHIYEKHEKVFEFTESADDDVDGYTDYFDHVDLGKENSERPANKQVKNYVSADVPCALCNKTVSSKPYLQMHMKYVHKDDENVLKCSQRPDLFGTETEVNEHIYEKHEKVIEKTQRKPPKGPRVSCAVCDKGFPVSLKYKLSHHIRELHPQTAHKSEQCNYSCLSEEDLETAYETQAWYR